MKLTKTYSDTCPPRPAYFQDEVDARTKELELNLKGWQQRCTDLENLLWGIRADAELDNLDAGNVMQAIDMELQENNNVPKTRT